jgi:SIR2-like domain
MSLDLKNDHNVFVLGAGFSRDANMPLIGDFLVRMRDSHPWLEAKGRVAEANAVRDVLTFRLNASSAAYWTQLDLENIEELFSLASSSDSKLTQSIRHAIAATLDFSEKTMAPRSVRMRVDNKPWTAKAGWLNPKAAESRFYPDLYVHNVAKLLGIFRGGRMVGDNTFITFNYDTVLEDALAQLGISFGYSFKKQSVDYDASSKAVRDDYQVKILKLHGSINWARRKKSGRTFAVFGHYDDVRAASATPELVPPTWKKVFEDQLAHIWNSAVDALRGATRLVVIGFSIPPTDIHFKYLLASGLQENISIREILFFNPENVIEDLKSRAEALLRQQYIDKQLISFTGADLFALCCDNRALARIGRPIWSLGDSGSVQIE